MTDRPIRTAAAIAKNPGKTDRAIAAEAGVAPNTVGKARKSTVTDVTVADANTQGTSSAPETKNTLASGPSEKPQFIVASGKQ